MENAVRYTVFKTRWGYFGLAGAKSALLRTHLPIVKPEIVKSALLANLSTAKYEKNLFSRLQQQITAYFEGTYVNFPLDFPIILAPNGFFPGSGHLRQSNNPLPKPAQEPGRSLLVNGFSLFAAKVLTACRTIKFGQTTTYGQLAKMAGSPKAARAVAGVMAKNPLPLIIPCHRVLQANNKLGGFSAPGGIELKKSMLELESHAPNL